jgi:hypothetical protein
MSIVVIYIYIYIYIILCQIFYFSVESFFKKNLNLDMTIM